MQTEEKHTLEEQVALLSQQLQSHMDPLDEDMAFSDIASVDGMHAKPLSADAGPRDGVIAALNALQGTLQVAAGINHASNVHTRSLDLMKLCRTMKSMMRDMHRNATEISSDLVGLVECLKHSKV
jgi:hypothetical protein